MNKLSFRIFHPMKQLIGLILISLTLVSCEDLLNEIADEVTPEGSSTATISGNLSLNFDGDAEFFHSVISTQNASTLQITLTNSNEIEVIDFLIGDLDNGDGIKAGTYEYNADPNGQLQFIPKFISEDDIYLVDATSSVVNKITISSVKDLEISGSFEINLTNLDGKTVMITGEFEAVGLTNKI